MKPSAKNLAMTALLVAATVLAHWPVCSAQLINWDDLDQIVRNPDMNPPRLGRMIEYVRGPYVGSLYPVSYWFLGAVAAIARHGDAFNPHVFHVASLILHVIAVLLALGLLRDFFGAFWPAWVGASFFALHPVQVEAAAWVSGFNTVLSVDFALGAAWLYVRFLREPLNRKRLLYACATVMFVLALMTKPSVVILPLVVAILQSKIENRKSKIPWLIWLALALPIMLITRQLQQAELVTPTPIWFRPFVALDALAWHLFHLLWPTKLVVDYGRSPTWLLESGMWRWTWIFPVILTVFTWQLRRKFPPIWIGLAIFAAALLPVLGLTPFNGQTISTVSDRFAYLAMLGPALVFGALAQRVKPVVIILPIFAVLSFVRASEWRNEQTLFTIELERNRNSIAAHTVLGTAASNRNDLDGAIKHYSAAYRVKKDDPKIPYNLGNALLRAGRPAEAIEFYEASLRLKNDARTVQNLAVARAMLRDARPATQP